MINKLYGEGLSDIGKRRLSAIRFLIFRDLPQQVLGKRIGDFLGEETNEKDLSKVVTSLEKLKIVKVGSVRIPGKKGRHNLVSIPKDHQTLVNLITYLYSIKNVPLLLLVKRYFAYSKYCKEVIDPVLVLEMQSKLGNILKKYGNMDFAFEEEEKQLILNILQSSPSALYYATKLYQDDLIEMLDFSKLINESISAGELGSKLKEHFIFKLQAYLGEDISKISSYDPIEYTTTAKFLPKEIIEEEFEKDYIYNICLHLSQEITGHMFKRTIRTHNKMKVPEDLP